MAEPGAEFLLPCWGAINCGKQNLASVDGKGWELGQGYRVVSRTD